MPRLSTADKHVLDHVVAPVGCAWLARHRLRDAVQHVVVPSDEAVTRWVLLCNDGLAALHNVSATVGARVDCATCLRATLRKAYPHGTPVSGKALKAGQYRGIVHQLVGHGGETLPLRCDPKRFGKPMIEPHGQGYLAVTCTNCLREAVQANLP